MNKHIKVLREKIIALALSGLKENEQAIKDELINLAITQKKLFNK